ncbi:hypothetical protein [Campylobacter estrildidarum]|uniref:Uncharacterized protein n=1 Tax=Campylobacter estrildidarum TaxID=2510189 RepID=A0A4U7BEC0_9BACT|nr:hypothetical protein [Campylobacter estrildidarum]TKX28165.1 hypothetical protein CQA69_08490 [Campylobacter estrildidarum]
MKENISYENYEKNLKLELENKRKDFDSQISQIIPGQTQMIKLYFWFATLIISGLLTISGKMLKIYLTFSNLEILQISFFILTFICGMACIFFTLKAILTGATIYHPIELKNAFEKFPKDKCEHVKGLERMINATYKAIKANKDEIIKTAKQLRLSFYSIVLCLSFFIIFLITLIPNFIERG